MTYDEAVVCLNYGLLVKVVRKLHNQEYMYGQTYSIYSLGSYLPQKHGNGDLIITAGIGKDFRSIATVTLDAIEVANSFSNVACKYLRDGKTQQFKSLIEDLMNAGLNQTQITDRVKKIYKQLKGNK